MSDIPDHKRFRTVLDDVADANDARYVEWLKTRKPGDPHVIEATGRSFRIRGMIEDGKLILPGEDQ